MNKVKIIIGYILGVVSTILLTLLIGLIMLNSTIFNKSYLIGLFEKNNYYEKINNEIIDGMKDYMVSSGLQENVLDGIYNESDVKEDINLYIDTLYNGEELELDTNKIKTKLQGNIDDYLINHKVSITSQESIDSFIDDISEIYERKVTLYGSLDDYKKTFNKLNSLINVGVTILSICLIVIIIILFFLKVNYLGSIVSASGIVFLFSIFVFYNKVDVANMLLISEEFTIILRNIFDKLATNAKNVGYALIIIGVCISFVKSFEKKDKNRVKPLKKRK